MIATALDDACERLACHQLHRQKQVPVELAELDDLDDVGMRELRRQLGFTLEPLHDLGVAGDIGVQQLQRDRLPSGELQGAIHAPHAALSDDFEEAVAITETAAS
jgi:hypothetical protein